MRISNGSYFAASLSLTAAWLGVTACQVSTEEEPDGTNGTGGESITTTTGGNGVTDPTGSGGLPDDGTGDPSTGGTTSTGGASDPGTTGGTGGTPHIGGNCGTDEDNGADLFRVTPYLQNSTGNSITVMSISNEDVTGVVELFDENGECLGSVDMEVVEIPDSAPYYRNAGYLSGLNPATDYSYKLILSDDAGGITATERASFRTLDPTGNDGRFVVLNDNHENWDVNTLQAGYATDFDPDLFFYNGDAINDPGSAEHALRVWQNYVTAGRHHEYTMDFIMGNHEWRGGWRQQMAYIQDVQFLDYNASEFEGKYQRAFTHANTRFIVLDGGEDWSKLETEFVPMREAQASWLQDEVASPEFASARFRILLMHMPLWGGDQGHKFQPFFQDTVANASPQFDLAIFAHTHTARFMESDVDHPFPIFIGGGKEVESSTNIQVVIDGAEISVEMRDDRNEVMDSLKIPAP